MAFETGLSPVTLDPRISPYRVPERPKFARGLGFERGFDYFTLFYDVFADEDPDWIVALGPPLPTQLQLNDGLSFRCASSGARLQAEYVPPKMRWSTGYFRIQRKRQTDAIHIQIAHQHVFRAIQPNLSRLFSGRRVLLAKNRDNPLEWIVDWARYHAVHFGIDAVVLFDTSSSLYEAADIKRALSQVPGLAVILVVDWPFPYQAPSANGWLRAHERWADNGYLEVAWRRFLLSAAFVAHLDIDELLVQRTARGLDNLMQDTACPWFRLQSQNIVAWPGWGTQLPRHRLFTWATAPLDNMRPKWIVVPNRCPPSARWWIHQIEGAACCPVDRDEFRIAHFLPLTTGWGGRSGRRKVVDLNPSEHRHDPKLQQRLDEAFDGWEPACRPWHPIESGDANLIRACAQEAFASGKMEEAALLLAEAMVLSPYHHSQHLLLRDILTHLSPDSAREGA